MNHDQLRAARWTVERAEDYMKALGVIKGTNFVPSYCYGYIEIWHHYDEPVILRELKWAKEIGLNSLRIFVNTAQWQTHRDLVYQNLERFLDTCKVMGFSIMLSLAAGTCMQPGYTQQYADPFILRPNMGKHDAGWKYEGVGGKDTWLQCREVIHEFVRDIVTRYAQDDRVAIWDLYNEAPAERVSLVHEIFSIARAINPKQPLTACWQALDISDVVTFHCYMEPNSTRETYPAGTLTFEAEVEQALSMGRPTLCTECLGRTFGNELASFLPIFEKEKIGFYVWGLCEGSAQYRFPWGWPAGSPEPKRWFHCLLYPDGTAYDESEIDCFKAFQY